MTNKTIGISFPLSWEGQKTALCEGDQRIKERIRSLLSIRPGEQVMQRDFGCDLYAFVHEPLTEALQPLISFQIQQALQRWLPEVKLESCTVKSQTSSIEVTILYTILRAQRLDQLHIELPKQ